MFQLMRHFPERFAMFSTNPDKPEEYIWGYHKILQVANTKRPGVDIGESTGKSPFRLAVAARGLIPCLHIYTGSEICPLENYLSGVMDLCYKVLYIYQLRQFQWT